MIKKSHVPILIVLWSLVVLWGVCPANLMAQEPQDLFADTMYRGQNQRLVVPTITRTRFVTVDFNLFPADTLELNLFGGVYYRALRQHQETDSFGWTSWVGRIDGTTEGQVVLVYKDGVMAGHISVPNSVYKIQYAGDGVHALHEMDPSKFPAELPGVVIGEDSMARTDISNGPDSVTADSGGIIDILVAYTPAARDAEGGTAAILANITLAITLSNTGYSNSGVTQRLRLVHTTLVNYSEASFNWNTTLYALQDTNDGVMDEIHTLRDTYGADEVVLVVSDADYCGLGYVMQAVSPSFAPYAFCLVSCASSCLTTNYSFAHELGHTMGSHHDRANAGGGEAAYSYSYGYQAPDQSFRTIMAYNCASNCSRVNYWSNPEKTYNGQPMGVIYTDPLAADNRRSLNNTASTVANFRATVSAPTITVTSPNGGESWAKNSVHTITWNTTGTVGNVKIEYSTTNGSNWSEVVASTANDGSHPWTLPNTTSTTCKVRISEAADGSPTDTSNAVFAITGTTTVAPKIDLGRTHLDFGANTNGTKTNTQTVLIGNSGGGTLTWNAVATHSWLQVSPVSGSQSGILAVTVLPTGLAVGNYTSAITVSATDASNSPQTITVDLTVLQAGATHPPFGEFSTPLDSTICQGSIPVTGWVLDDIEVVNVKIYNGSDYIGDAVFVEGARPDVASAYPGYPKNYQAGWGYMLLSNFLPAGGNGNYTLYAMATDTEGNQVSLGSKRIAVTNSTAVKPFGAIDTPEQGGIASGTSFLNWGWALTPQPSSIPTNGSSIDVWIDGVTIGHPTYNNYRSDIASLFPGYANSNGAVGYKTINTTVYKNGIHTLQWTVTDNNGNADGIGSRYFSVQNIGMDSPAAADTMTAPVPQILRGPVTAIAGVEPIKPMTAVVGYGQKTKPQVLYPDKNRRISIAIPELERVEVQVCPAGDKPKITPLTPLPIGSTWNAEQGIFYWSPGPGFVGQYPFVFVEEDKDGHQFRREVTIHIVPKFKKD